MLDQHPQRRWGRLRAVFSEPRPQKAWCALRGPVGVGNVNSAELTVKSFRPGPGVGSCTSTTASTSGPPKHLDGSQACAVRGLVGRGPN